MNQKYKSLISDTAAFAISNFASKVLIFLLVPLYTSVLSTNDYGIADLITNTINVIYPILTLNIMEATLRFAFDSDVSKEDVLTNSILFVVVSEIILVILTPIVGTFSSTMENYWTWFCIIFLGYNLQQILSQYIKGIEKTKIFAVSGIINAVTLVVSNIVGLLILKMGLNAYLFSIAAGYFATAIYLIIAGKIRIKSFHINSLLLKNMLRFSLPTIPNSIAWWVSTSADKYIIIYYLGISVSGIYSVAYKIPSILTLITSIFNSAWTISAIQNIDDDDRGKFQSVVYKYFNIGNTLTCSILILFSQFLGKIFFAKDFYEAWKCVPLLLVAYLFSGLAAFFASSFRATKYTKGLLSSTLLGAFVNVTLNFFVIEKFGMMGAAFTTMLGFAITFYIRSRNVKKIIDINFDLKKDTFIYFLLIIQAFIISLEIRYSYLLGTVIFAIIIFIYRKDCKYFICKVVKVIKDYIHRSQVN